jgi:hypothetical protein
LHGRANLESLRDYDALGKEVVRELLVERQVDALTEKEADKIEYKKLLEYVIAGKRDQLWNVTANIQTPSQQQAVLERLKRNLSSRERLIRDFSGRTLAAFKSMEPPDSPEHE